MTHENKHTSFFEDTARYLSDEMNALQKADFEKELQEDQELHNEFLQMKQLWENMDGTIEEPAQEIDTDKAWSHFTQRLNEQDITTSPAVRKLSFSHLLKWAAVFIFVAGLASYFALYNNQRDHGNLTVSNDKMQLTLVKTLEDGTLIYLSQRSSIEFDQHFNQSERSVFLSGEGYFDVSHDPEKPFKVHTRLANIEVLGTSFNVKMIDDNQMELYVESGRVKVSSLKGDRFFMVEPGELLITKNGRMEKRISEDYDTYWRKNMVHFKDEKLENILYALSKTFGTSLVAADEELKQRTMTLTIYDSKVKTVCESIALSLSVDYEWKEDSTVVFKSRN